MTTESQRGNTRINEQFLATKAMDNRGYEYPVSVFQLEGATGKFAGKWIIKIHDTSGSWYLHMLLKERREDARLAIDYGQDWWCTNLQPLLAEASALTGTDVGA